MSNTQEFRRKVEKVQGQTLDTARKAQDVVVEAVTAWAVVANAVPGYDKLVNQFPDATEVIDTHFDFARQILDGQRDFADRVVVATAPKVTAPAATIKKSAPRAITSAPAKKSAPRKAATAAKKPAAVRTVTAK